LLGLRPAPEFESWLQQMGIFDTGEHPGLKNVLPEPFSRTLAHLPGEVTP
jgi:ethanolamine ammonia-lyase large subunit